MDDLMASALGEMLAAAEIPLVKAHGEIVMRKDLKDTKSLQYRSRLTFKSGKEIVIGLATMKRDGKHYLTPVRVLA